VALRRIVTSARAFALLTSLQALVGLVPAVAPASAQGLLSLEALQRAGFVEVSLDTARFRDEQVAVIQIVNKLGVAVEGEIGACEAVFESDDARLSRLTPRESSRFSAGPKQTVELARLFRAAEPSRRPPERQAYRLAAFPDEIPACRE
jgi:hypothetical protein